jgi:hypothetical protein
MLDGLPLVDVHLHAARLSTFEAGLPPVGSRLRPAARLRCAAPTSATSASALEPTSSSSPPGPSLMGVLGVM